MRSTPDDPGAREAPKAPQDPNEAAGWPAEEWPFTALLRGARAAFGSAIRQALAGEGYDDLPPNGPYVIGAVARTAAPLSAVVRQLGVSKQAGGQLVDTLVVRGYLDRTVEPADRRRLVVRLTDRGQAAGVVIRAAVDALEGEMEAAVGAERVQAARQVLATLVRRGTGDA